MKYGVWCEVWGGVTGHRQSWMRRSGVLAIYHTLEEAEAEAKRVYETNHGDPHRKAEFRYTAQPMA